MRDFLLILLLTAIYGKLFSQTPSTDSHWNLIFEEHFSGTDIDNSVWNVAHDFDHYGEPQVYLEDNVTLDRGNLVITVQKERYQCYDLNSWACNKEWYDYTSGWVETNSSHNFQYGYISSRIKLPYGQGFWPAFWTFKGQGVTGNAAEIDIFEMTGHRPSTVMGTNLHMKYCCKGCEVDCSNGYMSPMCPDDDSSILCYGMDINIPSYTNWHTYAVEWSPSKIIWYIDGIMVRVSSNPGIHDPVKIILNLAIFPWSLPDNTTPFPSKMYVDHLHVYELEYDNLIINSNSYDFTTYNNKVKKSISIGGGLTSINAGDDYTLRATDFIELNGDFNVPLGASLYLDVN